MLFSLNDDEGCPFILTSSILSSYKIEYSLLRKQQEATISESQYSSLNLEKIRKNRLEFRHEID